MDIRSSSNDIWDGTADTIFIFCFTDDDKESFYTRYGLDQHLHGMIQNIFESGEFAGKLGETAVLYVLSNGANRRLILTGLSAQDSLLVDDIRKGSANALRKAKSLNAKVIAIAPVELEALSVTMVAQAVTEGIMLANYAYSGQKTTNIDDKQIEEVIFHVAGADDDSVKTGIEIGVAMATGTNTARDLANLPPNICTPIYLASKARRIADDVNLKIEIFERKQLEALKMGAMLAVAQGSETPPRFIVLEHNAEKADDYPTIVLVGKGVTFDTGGYSIKTSDGMVGMKLDMSGAAAVLGAMQIIGMLDLPIHAVGLVPAVDNMISGRAYRPQDVVTASNGKTIEVISTDAEGRMLLADALVYANRYNPLAVVDIATLTGACVTALGSAAAGFFVTDDILRDKLLTASNATSERIWQLPLFDEYRKLIESHTADIKNSGGRGGGVGTSAMFLKEFVDFPSWAHIDMAGVMQGIPDVSYIPDKGATGYGARLLAECVRQYIEESE